MWTDYSIMGKFETGRVYVVYQDKNVSVGNKPSVDTKADDKTKLISFNTRTGVLYGTERLHDEI
jgi:hypothetical protein